jgi:hypothetical protein
LTAAPRRPTVERVSSQGDQLRARLGREFARVRNALALEIAANIDERMPVDTGWARANTIPSLSAPAPVQDGDDVGSAEAAKAVGAATLIASADATADAYVTNHVRYVARLNRGHSPQAPANFLEDAADAAIATVAAAVAVREVVL